MKAAYAALVILVAVTTVVAWWVCFQFDAEMARPRPQAVIVLAPGTTITTPPAKIGALP